MDCIQSVSLAANYYVTCANWQHISDSSFFLDIPHVEYSYIIHGDFTDNHSARLTTPYRIWIMISFWNSHLARWYKFPSRRAVSSHSTLTPGIFAYLSDGCLWVTRYSLPSRCASRTLDLLRYFSWILAISPLRENKFSLWVKPTHHDKVSKIVWEK